MDKFDFDIFFKNNNDLGYYLRRTNQFKPIKIKIIPKEFVALGLTNYCIILAETKFPVPSMKSYKRKDKLFVTYLFVNFKDSDAKEFLLNDDVFFFGKIRDEMFNNSKGILFMPLDGTLIKA